MDMLNKGFSLIGVLIAVLLLTTGIVLFGRVATSRNLGAELGRKTLIATALAREGLELTRAVRDTNWLARDGRPWTHGLCETDQPSDFTIDAYAVRNNLPPVVGGTGTLWRTERGEWRHEPGANAETGFSRVLQVECATATQDPAFVTVTARVTWEHQSQPREVTLKEKLFNWYP